MVGSCVGKPSPTGDASWRCIDPPENKAIQTNEATTAKYRLAELSMVFSPFRAVRFAARIKSANEGVGLPLGGVYAGPVILSKTSLVDRKGSVPHLTRP